MSSVPIHPISSPLFCGRGDIRSVSSSKYKALQEQHTLNAGRHAQTSTQNLQGYLAEQLHPQHLSIGQKRNILVDLDILLSQLVLLITFHSPTPIWFF